MKCCTRDTLSSNRSSLPIIKGGWWLTLSVFLLSASGCYHYRVVAPRPDPATEHALFWGLLQEDVRAADCVSNALDEVRVTTNAGYLLVSTATLGIWVPLQLEWRCSKSPSPEGRL